MFKKILVANRGDRHKSILAVSVADLHNRKTVRPSQVERERLEIVHIVDFEYFAGVPLTARV